MSEIGCLQTHLFFFQEYKQLSILFRERRGEIVKGKGIKCI